MSNVPKNEINALRSLLTTAVDGRKGFNKAIETCTDASANFRMFLQSSLSDCQRAVHELRDMLRAAGETVEEEDGSLAGDLHRGWIETRAAFTANEEEAFAAEIVRGEEHAVKKYEEALEDIQMPSHRSTVNDQLSGLRQNLAEARAFAKQMAG